MLSLGVLLGHLLHFTSYRCCLCPLQGGLVLKSIEEVILVYTKHPAKDTPDPCLSYKGKFAS